MRIGVVGTNWGLMHVGAFRAVGAEVAALAGREPERVRQVAEREGVPLATTEVSRLCGAVDCVVVASPVAVHAAHVEAALAAGRHVLCEKPLTPSAAEARQLAARADASGRVCAVNFPYRMLPTVRALKEWLAGRAVRQLVGVVRNHFASADGASPDGSLLGASGDFGGLSHVVDLALWLSGDAPAWVQASLSGVPVHSAALHLGLGRGGLLTLHHLACPEPGIHGSWSLVGEGWEAGFSAGYVPARGGWCLSPVRLYEGGHWRTLAGGREPQGGREPWAEAHVETARHFLAAVRGGPREGLATLAEGALVQQVLQTAAEAHSSGRRLALTPRG